jgi:hypothetical protein
LAPAGISLVVVWDCLAPFRITFFADFYHVNILPSDAYAIPPPNPREKIDIN